jgi:hypothetical protein
LGDDDEQSESAIIQSWGMTERSAAIPILTFERLLICNILISFIIIQKVKYELDRKIQA